MATVHHLVPDAVEDLARLAGTEHWCLDVAAPARGAELVLPEAGARERVLCAASTGLELVDAAGRRVALRAGEPQDPRRAAASGLVATGRGGVALVLDHDPRHVRAALALHGTRPGARLLESLGPAGHAVVLAVEAGVRVRVSGEEEPFALDAGEALWIEADAREATFDLAGGAALVALVESHAPRRSGARGR